MSTFGQVALDWHYRNKARWSDRYSAGLMKRITASEIKDVPIAAITLQQVLKSIRAIEDRGVFEPAKRELQLINNVMRYAEITGIITANPAEKLSGALTKNKRGHYASLHIGQLPDFISAVDNGQMGPQTRAAINLLLLTFVRPNELIAAKKKEFNLSEKIWEIPAERMKMRKSHLVPLSNQAMEIIEKQMESNGDFLLSCQNWTRPMGHATILAAIYRIGYKDKMTAHGFRSLARTAIREKLNYPVEVIERQLAHSHNKAYDRTQFIDERKKMMQDWSNYIMANCL